MSPRVATDLAEETMAALRAIDTTSVPSPEVLLHALASFGDAMRLGLEVPSALPGTWLARMSASLVCKSLGLQAAQLEKQRTAGAIEAWVRQRDQVESVRRAVLRMSISGQWDIAETLEAEELEAACSGTDARLRAVISRSDVEGLLGVRGVLGAEWAASFPGPPLDPPSVVESSIQAAAGDLARAVPNDEIVSAYVRRGVLQQYVETVASRNASFAEELTICIDALAQCGEPLSQAALAWRGPAPAPASVAAPPSNHDARLGSADVLPFQRRTGRREAWPVLAAAAVLIIVGGGTFAFYKNGQEQASVTAQKNAEIAEQKAQLDKLMSELKAQNDAMEAAQAEIASAKTAADRAASQAKIAALRAQQQNLQTNIAALQRGPAATGVRPTTTRPRCTCDAGDPLCSCL